MRYAEIINEMMWQDSFSAAEDARRFPNAWIHFSNIRKLGVHPQPQHRDPPGIYFYPVKWLFSDDASLSQFATEYPYYYIVKVNKGAKIINLGKIKAEEVVAIAQRNGWYADLQALQADPKLLASENNPMDKKLLRKPGGMFYAALDYLANKKGKPWLAMLRGYDGLYDPNHGIISKGEISQMVVFGRQFITVLAHGNNNDNSGKAYAEILQKAAANLDGQFYFKHKVPQIDFANDGKPCHVDFDLRRGTIAFSYYKDQFWMTETEKYNTYGGDRDYHTAGIISMIKRRLAEAGPKGYDFFWNGSTVASLLRLLSPSKVGQKVDDEGLHVWASMSTWGNHYSHLRGLVDQQGHLTLDASIEEYSDGKSAYKVATQKMFDESDRSLQTAAKVILDALAAELIEKLPNPAALAGREEWFGFRFGNRFNGLASDQPSTAQTPE